MPQQMLANVLITIQPDKPLERFRGDPGPESLERRTRIYRECSLGSPSLCSRPGPRGSSLPAPWLPRVAALGSACGAGLGAGASSRRVRRSEPSAGAGQGHGGAAAETGQGRGPGNPALRASWVTAPRLRGPREATAAGALRGGDRGGCRWGQAA